MKHAKPKVHLFLFILFIPFLFNTRCEKETPIFDYHVESEHFILISNSEHTNSEELNLVKEHAEWLYRRIILELGEDWELDKKITIRLEGTFVDQGPYFDIHGIHLFRYSPIANGYLALLAHEMGHAFQEPYYIEKETWNWPNYGYYDEGFAEYLSLLIESEKQGYPFYGFPEDIVVGDLVKRNHHLPHEILRTQHEAYNERCKLQAYPQRASWFRHLDEVYGRTTMISIIHPERELTSTMVKELTGKSLVELDEEWEQWIRDRYENIPDADELARSYRNHTSWYSYCSS